MRKVRAVALASGLALAGGFGLPGPAQAQDVRDDGIDCVYLALGDDYELVAENFIYGDLSTEEAAEANAAIDSAKSGCAVKHSYSPGQLQAVGELGILAAAIDYLSEELMFSDVSDAAVDGVLDAYDAFTGEEVDAIFDPDWRSDAAFYAELKARMLSAGIPDEADLVETALSMLEVAAMAEDATYMFIMADDAPDTVP